MKRIVFVLFFLFSLCVPAYATNFVRFGENNHDRTYIDVDSISLVTSGYHEYIGAWMKTIYEEDTEEELSDEYEKTVDYVMTFIAFNKKHKQIQVLSIHFYDTKGNIINNNLYPFKMSNYEEVDPDSSGEDMYDFVMNYYNK